MSFDYPYTCPKIDRASDTLHQDIEAILEAAMQDISRTIGTEIEFLRDINSDMRGSAESQIEDLKGHIEDLEQKIADLEDEIDGLDRTVLDLESQL